MTTEENRVLVQRFIDEIMNAENPASIDELCLAGSMFAGGIEGQFKAMRTAFPDIRFTVEDMLSEGNKVAARVTVAGTNSGPLVGLPAFGRLETPVPPTGKSISHGGIYVFTILDGKIMKYAAELDQIGLLRQLGWTFSPPSL